MKLIFRCVFLITWILAITCTAELVTQDEIDQKMHATLGESTRENSDLSWLTDLLRPLVIERLIENLKSPEPATRAFAEKALVSIGHEETLVRLIDQQMYEHSPALQYSATEAALPYLIPRIKDASTDVIVTGDVISGSTRDYLTHLALGIINGRKVFPEETREWAKQMMRFYIGDPEGHLSLLHEWWANNQEAIIEKRYADANWLPRKNGQPYFLDGEEMHALEMGRQQQRITRQARRDASNVAIPESHENQSIGNVGIGIAAAILILLGFFVWKFKRIA